MTALLLKIYQICLPIAFIGLWKLLNSRKSQIFPSNFKERYKKFFKLDERIVGRLICAVTISTKCWNSAWLKKCFCRICTLGYVSLRAVPAYSLRAEYKMPIKTTTTICGGRSKFLHESGFQFHLETNCPLANTTVTFLMIISECGCKWNNANN